MISCGFGIVFEFVLVFVEQFYGVDSVFVVFGLMVFLLDDGFDFSVLKFNDQEWLVFEVFEVLVLVVNGLEEMEVVIIVDVLWRVGVKVVVVFVESDIIIKVFCSVQFVVDIFFFEVCDIKFDLVVLFGGMFGVDCFKLLDDLMKILKE